MEKKTYRAGIVGLGFIGGGDQVSGDALGQKVEDLDGTHAEAYANSPRTELVCGSSRDAGRRERFEARTGVKTYADWREMLSTEQPDIVSVATYTPTHAEITEACVAHGAKAVFCEKPIASTAADAARMIEACEAADALLVINHNRRFTPSYRRLRDLASQGGLGELTSCTLQWGSGRLGNVGTHMIDALQMLTGRAVEAVTGVLDLSGRPDCRGEQFQDPGGWGLMRLSGDLMVTVDAADYGSVPVILGLNGTEGRAVTGRRGVDLTFADGRTDHWPAHERGTSMDLAVSEIVAWLDGTGTFPYQAREALRTLEAILGFHVSHDRGGTWVDLPLTGEERERELKSG